MQEVPSEISAKGFIGCSFVTSCRVRVSCALIQEDTVIARIPIPPNSDGNLHSYETQLRELMREWEQIHEEPCINKGNIRNGNHVPVFRVVHSLIQRDFEEEMI